MATVWGVELRAAVWGPISGAITTAIQLRRQIARRRT
jgi:hypothetical protein